MRVLYAGALLLAVQVSALGGTQAGEFSVPSLEGWEAFSESGLRLDREAFYLDVSTRPGVFVPRSDSSIVKEMENESSEQGFERQEFRTIQVAGRDAVWIALTRQDRARVLVAVPGVRTTLRLEYEFLLMRRRDCLALIEKHLQRIERTKRVREFEFPKLTESDSSDDQLNEFYKAVSEIDGLVEAGLIRGSIMYFVAMEPVFSPDRYRNFIEDFILRIVQSREPQPGAQPLTPHDLTGAEFTNESEIVHRFKDQLRQPLPSWISVSDGVSVIAGRRVPRMVFSEGTGRELQKIIVYIIPSERSVAYVAYSYPDKESAALDQFVEAHVKLVGMPKGPEWREKLLRAVLLPEKFSASGLKFCRSIWVTLFIFFGILALFLKWLEREVQELKKSRRPQRE